MASAMAKVALEDYLAYLEQNCSAESVASYRSSLRKMLGEIPTISDQTVDAWLTRSYTNAATRNKVLGQVRSYAKWCLSKKKSNVTAITIRKYSRPLTLPQTVDDLDAVKFFAALESTDEHAWAVAAIMQATGMRIGEVYARIHPESLTVKDGQPYLHIFGKGGKERVIPVTSKVQRALTILSTERPSLRTIRRRFNEAEKIAGIDHFKPHWWRHTLATKLVAKGYSFTDISYLLGNTEAVCQTVYGRSNHTRLREMVDAVAR